MARLALGAFEAMADATLRHDRGQRVGTRAPGRGFGRFVLVHVGEAAFDHREGAHRRKARQGHCAFARHRRGFGRRDVLRDCACSMKPALPAASSSSCSSQPAAIASPISCKWERA